jgi:Carboxypeptidase regulatory-like domain
MPMADSSVRAFQYSRIMCNRDALWADKIAYCDVCQWRRLVRDTRLDTLVHRCSLILAVLLLSSGSLLAQQASLATSGLPDAPTPQAAATASANQSTATISGTVVDSQGAIIIGASVTLEDGANHEKKGAVTDAQGFFAFASVNAGVFAITIQSKGFAPVVRTGIFLRAGEAYQLSTSTMQVASAASVVEVSGQTQYELAEAQIKAEEKQRFLLFEPNFYVTYVSNPAPLTAGQKMRLATRFTLDPFTFIYSGVLAGIEQSNNDYPGYGQGATGYGKRYGATVGDIASGSIIGAGVLPAVLHQDPRYFYKGTGSIPSRIGYALAAIVRTKGDNGQWQPNYSGILGDLASGAISNSYLAASDRKGAVTVINGALEGFALRGVTALEQEFLARWITTHARDKGTVGHQ